jgi:hypothetical protein
MINTIRDITTGFKIIRKPGMQLELRMSPKDVTNKYMKEYGS